MVLCIVIHYERNQGSLKLPGVIERDCSFSLSQTITHTTLLYKNNNAYVMYN